MRNYNNDITPEDIFLDKEDTKFYIIAYKNNLILILSYFLIGILALVIWVRIFNLQVSGNQNQEDLLENPSSGQKYINSIRGNIYDRNGKTLAFNNANFNLIFNPKDLPKDDSERKSVIEQAKYFFDITEEDIEKAIDSNGSNIILKTNISKEKAILYQVEGNNLFGFSIEENQIREYIDAEYFSHIIGYVGKLTEKEIMDNPKYLRNGIIGKEGIEKQYESLLKGDYGLKFVRNNENVVVRDPINGSNIYLSIDADLQKFFADQIKLVLDEKKLTKASGIIINPKNGEILSMVSLPSYNNNDFIGGISQEKYETLINNKDNPLLNRCIAGLYSPASTVKPLLAGAFLQEGVVDTKTEINDPLGKLIVPNQYSPDNPTIFPDWKIHGKSNIYKAIASSVNVFFYTFSGGTQDKKGIGIEKLVDYYSKYGFGDKTGLDLPGEKEGLIANPKWKKETFGEDWRLGDTYNISIGQGGMLATPIQIINGISYIANGGKLNQPQLLLAEGNLENKNKIDKIKRENIISPENLKIVQDGMRQTVLDGTAYQLKDLPFSSAAKTGTAQTGAERNNSFFTAYAPFENPELAIIVLIEEGQEGYLTSIPVARNVLEWYNQNRGFNR